jgi:uncharacterized protein with HEPN domain
MRQALEWIEADVDGLDLERFVGDRRARQLVERNLQVLSEASRRIPHGLKAGEPDVDWAGLASLGSALRHEYQRVDPVLLWTLLTDELAPLRGALQRMEDSAPRDG